MSGYGQPHPYRRADDAGHDGYDSYGGYEDSYAADSYGADPYPEDSYGGRAAASVGAAAAGRARVTAPPAGPPEQPRPRYDWSRSGAGARGAQPAAGRATVPVSPGVGPATGRATVRPGGPGGPGGPAGTRPYGGAPRPPARKRKRHWLRNTFLTTLAVLVISAGGGMVALSYYVDSVPPPDRLELSESSTVLYSNGKEMASLQEVNREIIDTTVPELANIRNAVIAAEDKDFYDHSGVDFRGIIRAAWNNVTGGDRQGASTIDQQYARAAAGLTEDSYSRKLKEAAMAYKMNQELTKDEILDFYLNTIYLGRGAYGVQAAADAYFNKPAAELTVPEAAVIAGTIRIPDDGSGMSPYDPHRDPENPQVALERMGYVLDQMVDIDALDSAERAEITELPEAVDPAEAKQWHDGPQGPIVQQVKNELERMGITDLDTGGYRITTTIDREVQTAALDAARRKNKAGYWDGMPKNVDAAIVAINPADGAVLGYYGGEDGTDFDMAGPNLDKETGEWYGGRAPGSSFKVYTLIAELREGISFDTHWKTSEYDPDWLEGTEPIRNAGRDARDEGCEGRAPDYCTLRWSTQQSYNVPFAHFSEAVPDDQGPARILQAAEDAGIRLIKNTSDGATYDLTATEATELAPEHFFHPIAYGQYPVTVLDHASGLATLANRGIYYEPHFVAKVEEKVDGEWVQTHGDKLDGEQRVEQQYADAITGVLSTIPGITGFELDGGRPAAGKTGTWEYDNPNRPELTGNNDAWVVGYTPQIAAAVWVGDGSDKPEPIKDQFGGDIGSSGLPADIWQRFMNDAHAAKELPPQQFPQALPVGNPQHPYANGEQGRPERPGDDDCQIPIFCDDGDNDGDGDNGDGDNGGGDNGGGGNDGDGGGGNDGEGDNDGVDGIVLPIPTPPDD